MITSAHCRAARAWLNITQPELAKLSGVSVSTVRDFEREKRRPISNNLSAMQAALEVMGVVFADKGVSFTEK